jgi:hypothetical protein
MGFGIEVMYAAVDGTTAVDHFTCNKATRCLFGAGIVINFHDGSGFHVETKRKIVSVQYPRAAVVYTYVEGE